MAVLKSLLLLGRACSSSSLLIGSLPSSLHNRLSSSRFHPFSAYSPPAADRQPEIPFPEDLPSDYTKVDGGEECLSLTRKTKDEINVKTHVRHHDAELSESDDSTIRGASFNWIGDIDDELMVVDDKIVFVGKLNLKRKIERELQGEGEGGGGGGGDDDHGRSIWKSLKGFLKKKRI